MQPLAWAALALATAALAWVGRRPLRTGFDIARGEAAGLVWRLRHPRRALGICPAAHVRTRLDIFAPLDDAPGGRPVIISLHGGGWNTMRRPLFACSARQWVRLGLVAVVPDYTLYPRARYQQMADECAAAVAWTLEHCAEYGGDPRRVYLFGHSAGAHLGGLLAYDARWLARYGHTPQALAGFIGSNGVYDAEAEHDLWVRRFPWIRGRGVVWQVMGASREGLRAGSPVRYVTPEAPPTLLLHGEIDRVVPVSIGLALRAALQAAGVPVVWHCYPRLGHIDALFRAAAAPQAPLNRDILAFIRQTAAASAAPPLAAQRRSRSAPR